MINSRFRSYLFYILFSLLVPFQSDAQQVENSLLWRISGKNLAGTSYLFGTIHLQDKRVFHFTDSVYNAIQQVEGFAMEVHPDSMMMGLFDQVDLNSNNSPSLKSSMNKKDYAKLKSKLETELQVDIDKLTVKDAIRLKQKIIKPDVKEDDMPSIVDLYLYSIARDQGKKIAGLEKLSDQMDVVDEFGGNFKPEELLNDNTLEKNFIEKMIEVYSRQDLEKIRVMMSLMDDKSEDKILNFRNQGMVMKLDSLMQENSFFAAIGAAHLPGAKGVIELLRKMGYTVEPVMSANTLPAGYYQFKKEIAWQTFTDPGENFRIAMPGKTADLSFQGGAFSMYSHMDMTQMKMYFATALPIINSATWQNPDSLLNSFADTYFSSKGMLNTEKKRIVYRDSLKGMEIITRDPGSDFWMRMQLIVDKQSFYMTGVGSQKKSALTDPSSSRFFNSLDPLIDTAASSYKTFKTGNVEINFPGVPTKNIINNGDTTMRSVQYISNDKQKGMFFMLIISEAAATFVINDDSVYFHSVLDGFNERTGMEIKRMADTTVKKSKAKYILAYHLKEGFLMHVLMIKRGSQVYSLMATSVEGQDNKADIEKYFSSFSYLPYAHNGWGKYSVEENGLDTWAPSRFTKIPVENALTEQHSAKYYAFDSTNSITYQIVFDTLNAYTWSSNDTSLLSHWRSDYIFESNPLISSRFVTKGKVRGVEFITGCEDEMMIKKVRIYINGNVKLTAFSYLPYEFRNEVNQLRFFDELATPQAKDPGMVFGNSPLKLLDDLHSTDSATFAVSRKALFAVKFESKDFPLLLQRALQNYPEDSTAYQSVQEELFDVATNLADSSHIDLLEMNFLRSDSLVNRYSYQMLKMLTHIPGQRSFSTIRQLMEKRMPVRGNAFSFVYALRDSLHLAKQLYPFLLSKSDDSLLAYPLYILHHDMLDSGLIEAKDFTPYQTRMENGLSVLFRQLDRDPEDVWYGYKVIKVLGKLNAPVWDKWINRFLFVDESGIKETAALDLLSRNKPVSADTWKSIATDGKWRLDLYRELKKLKKEKLFPAAFLNQRDFAEAMLWESFEDEMPDRLEYIGEQVAMYKKREHKFFLFKVIYEYDGEKTIYLGIAGPFPKDTKKYYIENHVSGTQFDTEYTKGLEKKLLKEYLAYLEELAMETEEE
jgi:uncharacterized protein YbaP (TraB family)